MSTPANPSTNYLRLITEYYATQDGRVLYTQLWQPLTTFVNARVAAKQTLENLKSTVERAKKHVNAMRATQRANVEALDNYNAMKEARDTIRQTPQKLAAFDRANDAITEAYNNRKKITKDKYSMAEEKLVNGIADLNNKHKLVMKKRKQDKKDASVAKKQKRADDKKAEEEQSALEAAEKKAANDRKLEQETDIKLKRRETMAANQLALKAKAADMESDRRESAARLKKVDEEMLKALIFINSRFTQQQGRNSGSVEEADESEDEKENIAPPNE